MHNYSWVLCKDEGDWESQLLPFKEDGEYRIPLSWDWHMLGGRYTRVLLVKTGHYGIRGEESWTGKNWEEGVDLARLKVIDWERMRAEREMWMRPRIICNGKKYLSAFSTHENGDYSDRYDTEWWSAQIQEMMNTWTADGWLAVVDLHT